MCKHTGCWVEIDKIRGKKAGMPDFFFPSEYSLSDCGETFILFILPLQSITGAKKDA